MPTQGQYPKIKGLLKFAESFDSVVAAAGCESSVEAELKKIQEAAVFEEPAEPDAPGEVETPEAVATVKAKLEEVEAMLAQERGMNPNVILKNLTEIVPLWPAAESPELSDRLVTAFNTLKTRMSAACAAASREDQEAKLKARRGASTCGFTGETSTLESFVASILSSCSGLDGLRPQDGRSAKACPPVQRGTCRTLACRDCVGHLWEHFEE